MPNDTRTAAAQSVVTIEPGDRLVILARAISARRSKTHHALAVRTADPTGYGDRYLGAALYRHRRIFQGVSSAPVWGHFELTYFRDIVPSDAIDALMRDPRLGAADLLRAEILVTTPSSFVLPRGWQGVAGSPGRVASLEFLQVDPAHLGVYRDAMRTYCGPAATRLVQSGRFGTFRAMETAAVLYQADDLTTDWNQVHLCELDPSDFDGFGAEFARAVQGDYSNDPAHTDAFSDLGRLRTISRWTFNDPVFEKDLRVGESFATD